MLETEKLEKLDTAHKNLLIKYEYVKAENEELLQLKDKI